MSDADVTQLPPGANPQDINPPNYSNCNEVSLLCPVSATVYGNYFTLGPCIFFLAAHSVLLLVQTYLGIRSRAWTYAGYLAVGSIFEIMGYAARAALSHNPWIYNAFVIQLVLLMLGPTLVAAAISVTFKHLVLWYGREWSFIRPVLYPWLFVGPDIFSIIIQAAGGVVSAIATGGEVPDQDLLDLGSGLMIGGVVFQMVNMLFCGVLMLYYLWNRKSGLKNRRQWLQKDEGENSSIIGKKPLGSSDRRTKIFLCAMAVAYVAIIIRCVYRIPEQQMGWGSDLMQDETLFLIFDGAMILLSISCLTVFHPQFFFPFLSKGADKKILAGVSPAESDDYEMRSAPQSRQGAGFP